MLNDCGKSPFKLAHTGYEGKGWVIAYALYDSDDYSFDDGYSNAWTSKEDFDAFVDIPTSDGIKEMLAQNGRSNYREDYVVELYPIEATFNGLHLQERRVDRVFWLRITPELRAYRVHHRLVALQVELRMQELCSVPHLLASHLKIPLRLS